MGRRRVTRIPKKPFGISLPLQRDSFGRQSAIEPGARLDDRELLIYQVPFTPEAVMVDGNGFPCRVGDLQSHGIPLRIEWTSVEA